MHPKKGKILVKSWLIRSIIFIPCLHATIVYTSRDRVILSYSVYKIDHDFAMTESLKFGAIRLIDRRPLFRVHTAASQYNNNVFELWKLIFRILFCFFPGLRSPRCNMSRQAPVQAVQAQHGDQQRTHAQVRSREPLQVSLRNCQCLYSVNLLQTLLYYIFFTLVQV